MFKNGDIVWAKVNEYNAISYHRPCRVLSSDPENFKVKPFDCDGTFIVDIKYFEIVEDKDIFKHGEFVYHKLHNKVVKFYKYVSGGDILYKTLKGSTYRCDINEIRKIEGLYVY